MTPEFAAANAGYCPVLLDGEWHRVAVPPTDLRGGKALSACLKKGGCQRKLALISDEPTELTMKFEPTHVGCYYEKGIFRQAQRRFRHLPVRGEPPAPAARRPDAGQNLQCIHLVDQPGRRGKTARDLPSHRGQRQPAGAGRFLSVLPARPEPGLDRAHYGRRPQRPALASEGTGHAGRKRAISLKPGDVNKIRSRQKAQNAQRIEPPKCEGRQGFGFLVLEPGALGVFAVRCGASSFTAPESRCRQGHKW